MAPIDAENCLRNIGKLIDLQGYIFVSGVDLDVRTKVAADLGWKPVQYLNNVSASIGAVLTPAGLEKSVGLISTQYLKDPLDTAWADDAGMKEWKAFMAKYYPDGDLKDVNNIYGSAYNHGFDSQSGEYADLVKKGIIDPTKVVRTAIQNAASVAALLITTEAMVAELPKKNAGGPAMPPGGGMGGMDF